jgi:pimeloyl-ACP methyl ester carboxylesterase
MIEREIHTNAIPSEGLLATAQTPIGHSPRMGDAQMSRRDLLLWSALSLSWFLPKSTQAQPTESPMPSTLEPAVNGERITFESDGRTLSVYVSGSGAPLLLIHSVNAAASAAEVRPLHDHFQRSHTVYSIDLPGFGWSDRSDRAYTPRVMTDALHAVVALIRQRTGDQAIDALAVSLSSEFLARAATEAPEHFRTVALVSPTGLAARDNRRGPPGSTLAMPWLLGALRGPGWGRWLFKGLTRPGVIRFFLNKTWGSTHIDEALWRYAVATAQQAGAEHAPLQFISGGLFSRDIQNIYESLKTPTWMSHGVRGDFTDYEQKTLVASKPNWHISAFETGAMPYFELTQLFCEHYQDFLNSV